MATFVGDESIRIQGCSRTDSGVHAEQLFATFGCESEVAEPLRFLRGMRGLLPPDIAVKRIGLCKEEFHPVRSPHGKVYRYQVWNSKTYINPFLRDFVWHVPVPLDLAACRQGLDQVIGTHDFTSFAASDGAAKTGQRTIHSATIEQEDEIVTFKFQGSGFLKQMVRNIVGTIVEVGQGKRTAESIAGILVAKDRTKAGRTAPASGLFLEKVVLGEQDSEAMKWFN